MTTRWVIGLASGSSADGVEAALLELEGAGLGLHVKPVCAIHQGFSRDLRDVILRVSGPPASAVREVALLHRLLGETFAAAARHVADRASFSLQKVQCLGCAGHTVWHEPEGRFPASLGLGMAAVLAERTGVTTVSDFRARDMAVGGQGAPLTALVDHLLFGHPVEDRVLVHLGGLARIVYLPAGGRIQDVVGFEAGPCNILLDSLMRRMTSGRESFDPGGKHAVQGRCLEPLLERWLSLSYLQRRPPKSMPRHGFGDDFAQQAVELARQNSWSLHDLLCTATHFVARGITDSLTRFLPKPTANTRVLLSGGGVRNGLLWHLLHQQMGGLEMHRIDALGVPGDVRKPLGFGVLAALTLDGVPANVASATGAAGARLLGSITPGSTSNWGRCLAWMAQQAGLPELTDDE